MGFDQELLRWRFRGDDANVSTVVRFDCGGGVISADCDTCTLATGAGDDMT
jgi:hypothetical protein